MDKKELERYAFPVPKLELNDMQAGLESFDFIKKFLSKTLLTIDNIKNNLHIFNTLYRGENINELKELLSVKNSLNKFNSLEQIVIIFLEVKIIPKGSVEYFPFESSE